MKPLCALLALLLAACPNAEEVPEKRLPTLSASGRVTVSGISAGAYMAAQYQVAYSSSVQGAGLVAGGPWGCASGDIGRALGACMNGTGIDIQGLLAALKRLAGAQRIDPISGLANDAVFLFRGADDAVIAPAVTAAAAEWYQRVAPAASIQQVYDVHTVHGWPTVDAGLPCDEFAAPFVNACGVDLAGDMLQALHGPLRPPADQPAALRTFSQQEFHATGLAGEGLLFVPPQCRDNSGCDIHVFLHGCGQSAAQIGSALAEQSGLRRWAQSNDIIVLYPQVVPSQVAPINPLACWDWWGYSGANYLEKSAPQLAAIHAMISRLQSDD